MPPSSRLRTLDFFNLRPGMFADRHQRETPPGGAFSCNNVVCLYGKLRKRPGTSEYRPTGDTTPLYSLGGYVDFSGDRTLVRATRTIAGDVELYAYNGGWASLGPAYPGAAVSDVLCSMGVNFKGQWYFPTGSSGPLVSYDGTTLTDVRAAQAAVGQKVPNAPRLVAALPERLIVADMENSLGDRVRYRLAWSAQLDADRWRNDLSGDVGSGSAGFVDLADRTDPITALWASGDSILAFRARSIYQGDFVGPPLIYRFKELADGAGCISHLTLKEYRDGTLFWLGDDNVYAGQLNQKPIPIGNAIEPLIRDLVDRSRMECASAFVDQQRHFYHLFLPSKATGKNDLIFSYHIGDKSWWPGVFSGAAGIDVTCTFGYRDSAWFFPLLIGTRTGDIQEYSLDQYADDGSAFPSVWESWLLSIDTVAQGTEMASFQEMRGYSEEGGIRLSLLHGDGLDRFQEQEFGLQLFDGSSSVILGQRPYKSEHARARIEWDDAFPQTEICGFSIGAIPEGKVRPRC